ncbi:hypothetical protein AJ79_08232 [Helicocarpus griseus UAMH5409]|uniref:Uncharacterized protein n=1 Tax=Helicocarpus griseus UAMH5409 TaxID=1447875 RepID=A0A2B7WUY0_9EURO|nr:hypothetical protein AJ79_08232 [Helicocarpus griseus UAMH5409]
MAPDEPIPPQRGRGRPRNVGSQASSQRETPGVSSYWFWLRELGSEVLRLNLSSVSHPESSQSSRDPVITPLLNSQPAPDTSVLISRLFSMDPSRLQRLVDLAQGSPNVQTPQARKASFGADLEEHVEAIHQQVLSQTPRKLMTPSEPSPVLNFKVMITPCCSNHLQAPFPKPVSSAPVEDDIREEFKHANGGDDEHLIFESPQVCKPSAGVENPTPSFPEPSPEVQEVGSHKYCYWQKGPLPEHPVTPLHHYNFKGNRSLYAAPLYNTTIWPSRAAAAPTLRCIYQT